MEGRRSKSWLAIAFVFLACLAWCILSRPFNSLWAPSAGATPREKLSVMQSVGEDLWSAPTKADVAKAQLAAAAAAASPMPLLRASSALVLTGAALVAASFAAARRSHSPAAPAAARGSRAGRRARGGEAATKSDLEGALDLDGSFWDVLTNTDQYIEDDRRSRRPVFGYADWKRHRSANRFARNLQSLFVSTTIRANWKEVFSATSIAVLLCILNDPDAVNEAFQAFSIYLQSYVDVDMTKAATYMQKYVDFAKEVPTLSLPALPFTISSASLSLLLVFRTNKAYERWWEARCIWGAIINTCRDIVRQALVRIDPKDMALKEEVTRLVAAYPRSLIYHLGERTEVSDRVIEKKYRKILKDDETEKLLKCTHKPMTVTGMLSNAIHKANLPVIDEMKIDQDVTKFSDYYGMCERIFKTPMPLSFTRLTSRFLGVWLLALPFALYSAITPHWLIIPITALLAFFIFGLEEIGLQIEEPFSALPLNAMADGIDASIFEALEREKKDPFLFEPREGWTKADAKAVEVKAAEPKVVSSKAAAVVEVKMVEAVSQNIVVDAPHDAPAEHVQEVLLGKGGVNLDYIRQEVRECTHVDFELASGRPKFIIKSKSEEGLKEAVCLVEDLLDSTRGKLQALAPTHGPAGESDEDLSALRAKLDALNKRVSELDHLQERMTALQEKQEQTHKVNHWAAALESLRKVSVHNGNTSSPLAEATSSSGKPTTTQSAMPEVAAQPKPTMPEPKEATQHEPTAPEPEVAHAESVVYTWSDGTIRFKAAPAAPEAEPSNGKREAAHEAEDKEQESDRRAELYSEAKAEAERLAKASSINWLDNMVDDEQKGRIWAPVLEPVGVSAAATAAAPRVVATAAMPSAASEAAAQASGGGVMVLEREPQLQPVAQEEASGQTNGHASVLERDPEPAPVKASTNVVAYPWYWPRHLIPPKHRNNDVGV